MMGQTMLLALFVGLVAGFFVLMGVILRLSRGHTVRSLEQVAEGLDLVYLPDEGKYGRVEGEYRGYPVDVRVVRRRRDGGPKEDIFVRVEAGDALPDGLVVFPESDPWDFERPAVYKEEEEESRLDFGESALYRERAHTSPVQTGDAEFDAEWLFDGNDGEALAELLATPAVRRALEEADRISDDFRIQEGQIEGLWLKGSVSLRAIERRLDRLVDLADALAGRPPASLEEGEEETVEPPESSVVEW